MNRSEIMRQQLKEFRERRAQRSKQVVQTLPIKPAKHKPCNCHRKAK